MLRVPATPAPSKSALQVSVLRPVAEAFQLSNRQAVLLRRVRAEDVALDWVELIFKDQYMSRGDIFHYRRHLLERGPALYVGKICTEEGARAQVQGMVRGGAPVESGVLGEHTVFSFRSRCAAFVLLLQMSDEMWSLAPDGDLYHEKAVAFLRQLFRRCAAARRARAASAAARAPPPSADAPARLPGGPRSA